MTDLEIDKALALAIGWMPEQMIEEAYLLDGVTAGYLKLNYGRNGWRVFSHRDWNVIGPIAERYDCFPFRIRSKEEDFGKWNVVSRENDIMAASPQRAIALAVIQGAKK
jgi:hypothetical protein